MNAAAVEAPDFTVEPAAPGIGAVLGLTKAELLGGSPAPALRALLERHGVLVFPEAGFSEDEQIAFTRLLGTYVPDRPDGGATPITIDPEAGRSADYTRSAQFWHFDGYMNEMPILGSLLCCVTPAREGGETEFCNTYAAWDALPDEMKTRIEGLRAVHAMAGAQMSLDPEPSLATFREWMQVRSAELPLVWQHRSGRKSLVIGNTAVNIVSLDPLEGLEWLVYLRDWATREEFRYTHRWRAGDAVLWDNTGTLHRVRPYDPRGGRTMRRTKLAGEEPIG